MIGDGTYTLYNPRLSKIEQVEDFDYLREKNVFEGETDQSFERDCIPDTMTIPLSFGNYEPRKVRREISLLYDLILNQFQKVIDGKPQEI